MFTIPTLDELRQVGLNKVSNSLDKSENAMIYDAVSAGAVMAYEIMLFAENAFNKMDVENNSGSDLDRYVYLRTGIMRKAGTFAKAGLLFTGTPGKLIPQNYIVSSEDGSINFRTAYGDVIGEDGTVLIEGVSVKPGNIGHIPEGALSLMADSISGVTEVTNPGAVEDGTDPETDVQLRSRYYMHFRDRATSNNAAHYRQWAMEVAGVGQVRVVEAFNGPLSVKVILLDNEYRPADEELVDAVHAHILTRQSFDVEELLVVGADPVEINVTAELVLAPGYDDAEVKTAIADNIRTWLSTYTDPLYVRTMVSYYDIIAIVKQTEGVIDIIDLSVNGGTSNIPIGIEQVAQVGAVS